jgi:hypothetical protein
MDVAAGRLMTLGAVFAIVAGQAASGPTRRTLVQGPDTTMLRVASQTALVFTGTIRQRDSVTMPIVPRGPNTWVVRADSVLRTTRDLGDFRGMEITVRVQDTISAAVGTSALFFVDGLMVGRSLYVKEVGRFPLLAGSDTGAIRAIHSRFLAADSVNVDNRMRARLASSASVIIGTVVQIVPATAADSAAWREAADQPQWKRARVQTTGFFRGDSSYSFADVGVLFPGRTHVALRATRPLAVGDRRIFALRRATSLVRSPFPVDSSAYPFAVLFAVDVLPASDSARVFRVTR